MRNLVGNIVNGVYKVIHGDVPKSMLPYQSNGRRAVHPDRRKLYKVYIQTYTQLGYSGRTFHKDKRRKKALGDNSIKVLTTRGRTYKNLNSALKRIQHLEDICPENVHIMLIRMYEDNPRLQVLQHKHGTVVKK